MSFFISFAVGLMLGSTMASALFWLLRTSFLEFED